MPAEIGADCGHQPEPSQRIRAGSSRLKHYYTLCVGQGDQLLQKHERRLVAILAADVAGYSRLMGADESGTLIQFKKLRAEVIEPKIAEFNGRVVGSAGDSLLVEFASEVHAVQCAIEAQEGIAE